MNGDHLKFVGVGRFKGPKKKTRSSGGDGNEDVPREVSILITGNIVPRGSHESKILCVTFRGCSRAVIDKGVVDFVGFIQGTLTGIHVDGKVNGGGTSKRAGGLIGIGVGIVGAVVDFPPRGEGEGKK